MNHKFEIGDRVEYQNCYGHTSTCFVKSRYRFATEYTYDLVGGSKKGLPLKRGGLIAMRVSESELKLSRLGA
jgi:hypothetical protein